MIVPWQKWQRPRYGQEDSYVKGMKWLEPCSMVEDWGCGKMAYAKKYRDGPYIGIDGTGPTADMIADLSTYRSQVPGLFMRGILEHNHDWRVILQNALDSFTQRMFLMLYRPLQDEEKVIIQEQPVELDLPRDELMGMVNEFHIASDRIDGATHGYETCLYLEKQA